MGDLLKETGINNLAKVSGIGPTTAKLLFEIGIDSPEKLAQGTAVSIVKEFDRRKKMGDSSFWTPSLKSVELWIENSRKDNWEYSVAIERWGQIKRRSEAVIILPLDEFKKFYKKDTAERRCEYCGISEQEINQLMSESAIKTKRDRGEKMEIDRKNPANEYVTGNIALCCYWCNNAKTDEFTDTEFQPIADQIRHVWVSRGIDRLKN
jgi:5-methylcytosine-specific restriction endonuclease McrA